MVSHEGSPAGGPPGSVSLQLILDSFVAVASERDPSAILEQTVDLARLSTQARYGAAALVEEDGVSLFVHRGLTRAQVEALPHLPEGLGMLAAVLEEKAPIRLDHLQDDRRSIGFPLHHVPMAAFLGVPIMAQDDLLGAVYLTKPPGEGAFGEDDELFMQVLATQAGVALDVARLLRERSLVNEQLRDVVSMTSHELLTPLTSILGYSAVLRERWDRLTESETKEFIGQIDRQGHRLQQLVQQLLELGSIEAGAIETRPRMLPLRDTLREILDELGSAEAAVMLSCREGLHAFADADHLRQIVVNYVRNALKHGEPPVEVEVRAGEERTIEIMVRDHGPGVPAEFVPRLFTRFSRAMRGDPEAPEGFGLGLTIARSLAEAQGGWAWYEPGPPRGPAFCLSLPGSAL